MSADDYKLIDEQVGLWGAVALLVGTALGMSIFIVPTQMAAAAGPSITVAILASIVPMILGVLLLLQLGGAIPVAGGIYVYGSRLVGPFWGMIGVTVPVLAVWSYLLFAALGFSEYLNGILDSLGMGAVPPFLAVWFLLGLFLVLNYVGVQIVTKVQIGLVLVLIAGMLAFVLSSVPHVDPANYTPVFPSGEGEPFEGTFRPFILAVVTLYIPFQGFGMIIEIGEELENPVENIPRVLGIGMAIVTVLSIAIVFALVGAIPLENLTVSGEIGVNEEPVEGGLAAVGEGILPAPILLFVGFAALLAAATTVNTLFTSYSRTVMRAARDEVVPDVFAKVHDRYNTPHRAILLFAVPPIVAAPLAPYFDAITGPDFLDWLVVVVVSGIFIAFAVGGVALWNLPKVFPQRYEHSIYKLPMPVLRVVAVGNVVVSTLFTLLVVSSAPSAFGVVLLWMVLSAALYFYRIRAYEKKGIDLKSRMALLHKHEQVGGGSDD
ncbi:amino acid permease [Natronomonas salina]|uniref:APC family permease n=1 Tax=Natronomonas salina TaxID=1710540 RepID=UPI0015B679CD|nr:APC family permease [Natronomonas salina]QLD89396.1 amino acid permease [Natronomonas salina]